MKRAISIAVMSLFVVPAQAQSQAQSSTQSSSAQTVVQVECRDLASTGNYVAPNETIINGKACRPAGSPLQTADPSATSMPTPPSEKPAATAPAPAQPATADAGMVPLGNSTPASEQPPKGFLLEDGTPVRLVLSENVSSADAVTGQTVAFEVVEDVLINGFLVVPRGATAWATITDAEHKKHMGRGGKVDMNIDKVRLADGEKALLRAVKDAKGGGHGAAMTAGIVVTALVVWPAAPFFLFMHGKDVTIPKGTPITAFVQGDVVLDQSKFQKQLTVSK